jgi:multiple sugar transport system permease protein
MTSSRSKQVEAPEKKRTIPLKGKRILRVMGIIFIILSITALTFGILGFFGVGLTDTFYLEMTINEARMLYRDVDGVPVFTDESWEYKTAALIYARSALNDPHADQEEINFALENLRQALDSLVLTPDFAGTAPGEFIPDTRGIPTLFPYLLVLAVILAVTGILTFKFFDNLKKMRLLSILGMVSFVALAILVVFTADTLGPGIFRFFIPTLLFPIVLLIGVYQNDRKVSTLIVFGVLVILTAIVLFPLYWIVRTALMHPRDMMQMSFLPTSWAFENFSNALRTFHYFTYLRNTFIIATPAVVLGTFTAILCAYSFARLRFRFKKFFFGLCISSMMLPSVVTLIPLYIMFTNFFGFTNSFWPLIIPWICGGGAFNIFLMRQFMMTIPIELDEAAMIDGAGRLRILFNIIIPSIKPAIMVVGIFIFMLIWNDLLTQTIYLQPDQSMHTMAMGLRVFAGSYDMNWPYTMMATLLSIIPGVLIYIFGQKYLVEGIVMTGMKN